MYLNLVKWAPLILTDIRHLETGILIEEFLNVRVTTTQYLCLTGHYPITIRKYPHSSCELLSSVSVDTVYMVYLQLFLVCFRALSDLNHLTP